MSDKDSMRHRRKTTPVRIGRVTIGGDNPVAVQSMTNTPTMDTEASAAQIIRIAEAGGDIVRLTAQTPAHSRNLGEIRRMVRSRGCTVPLVADIHYNPAAAFAAAEEVEKVRINPGNFVDPGRKFEQRDYTDEEYKAELQRLHDAFVPFLELCASRGVAIRLGVNHGSLSDRIRNRYGDTPEGMVESAMEFLRICVEQGFGDVVISIKSSNVVVMTRTVRLLARTMQAEGMSFPLHLGVTEAGDGDDGRIKSAVGIGSLLVDGLGDTIRVSLSEDPEREIPVARMILDYTARTTAPEDIRRAVADGCLDVTVSYPATMSPEEVKIAAAVDLGYALLEIEGVSDNITVDAPSLTPDECRQLELDILQATRRKISKTEYIACPSCGRTLFDLQKALAEVKAATAGLKGLKIGVMGCVVNGPGEMADADYGYVGAGPGRVSLYKRQECVVKNIPADEALPRLIQLIKDNGDWPDESV